MITGQPRARTHATAVLGLVLVFVMAVVVQPRKTDERQNTQSRENTQNNTTVILDLTYAFTLLSIVLSICVVYGEWVNLVIVGAWHLVL